MQNTAPAVHEFDEEVEAAITSISTYVRDELIGIGWENENGDWYLGAPHTGRSMLVKGGKRRVENLLRYYASHFEKTGTHGI